MKKLILPMLLLFTLCVDAQFKLPEKIPYTDVYDYDKILSVEQVATLNKKLQAFRDSSSIEMAVIILSDLQDKPIEDVALQFGRTWGVGKKELNNGIVYLVAPKLRKARFEVGSGLEGDLPDITTTQIQDKVKPFYKNNQYYEGINSLIDQTIGTVQPISWDMRLELRKKQEYKSKQMWASIFDWLKYILLPSCIIGLAYIFLSVQIRNKKKRNKKRNDLKQTMLKEIKDFPNVWQRKISVSLQHYNKLCASEFINYVDNFRPSDLYKKMILYATDIQKNDYSNYSYEEINQFHTQVFNLIPSYISEVNKVQNQINEVSSRNDYVKRAMEDLPRLKQLAQKELPNTPYTEKDLREDEFRKLLKGHKNLWVLYQSVKSLSNSYNDIINYQRNERERKASLERQKKTKEANRLNSINAGLSSSTYAGYSNSSNDDNKSSYSSSSNSSSSSSDSGDYGGGSFSGGGSSSEW